MEVKKALQCIVKIDFGKYGESSWFIYENYAVKQVRYDGKSYIFLLEYYESIWQHVICISYLYISIEVKTFHITCE